MIKRMIAGVILAATLMPTAFGLGGYASLSGDDKKVAELLKTQLKVSDQEAFELFDQYLKSYLNTKDWHFTNYHNTSVNSSKLGNSSTRTLHMDFITDNRFINLTFIRFGNEGQVVIHTLETLPRSSSAVVEKSNSTKADAAYEVDIDKDSFAAYRKKGYTDRIKAVVNGTTGAIQYVDYYVHNLGGSKK